MAIRVFLFFIFSIALGYFSFGDLERFTGEAFLDVMGVLLNVASIIFAIIGAWIAIIYPKAIQLALSGDSSRDSDELQEATKDVNYLSELFQIVLQSATVIVLIVAVQVAMPLVKTYSYFGVEIEYVKAVSVSFMVFVSLVQINAVLIVVEKNFGLLKRLRDRNKEKTIEHDS